MKLDQKDKSVLYWIEMNAMDTVPAVARSLKLREGYVRYQLDLLKERGIIKNRRTFINTGALGYNNYVIYFSMGHSGNQNLFLQSLARLPQVWWMAEIGGMYQYAVSFSSESINLVIEQIEKLIDKHQVILVKKEVSIRVAVHRYSRKYLLPNAKNVRDFYLGKDLNFIPLDEVDKKVLRSISYRGELSQRELAKNEDIPIATFERRLKILEKNKIIQGYFYETDLTSQGVQQYVFLMETKGFSRVTSLKLAKFCYQHPIVRKLVSCVGRWDFEIEINITSSSEINQFRNEIYSNFNTLINDLSYFPLISHKSTPPFDLIMGEDSC